jgi:hypothetical protein
MALGGVYSGSRVRAKQMRQGETAAVTALAFLHLVLTGGPIDSVRTTHRGHAAAIPYARLATTKLEFQF